jgi:hypothetical protein
MGDSNNKMALPIGTVLQQYRIEAVLGFGGFGIVYKARHQSLDLLVAIKEYLPQMYATRDGNTVHPLSGNDRVDFEAGMRRFLEEARQLVRFDGHPNIVACRDFFEANGTAYLVMNFEEGEELSGILRTREQLDRPLNEQQILGVVVPILEGLAHIHAAHVLHRDIKPANVFIRRRTEQPVLIDFGASKGNFGTQAKSSHVHTEGYAPIEQIEEEGQLGPWTDLYAVGAMLWRIIAHRNPPKVQSRLGAKVRGAQDPMTSALEIGAGVYSEGLLRAIDRALQIDARDRFQSASEFIAAIAQRTDKGAIGGWLEREPLTIAAPAADEPTQVAPVAPAPAPAPGPARKPWNRIAVAAALALALGGGAATVYWSGGMGSATAETAKPSEDVLFSKMERMYDQANRIQGNIELNRGFAVDRKNLELVAQEAKLRGDEADYSDTLRMIERLTSKMQETELEIRHDESDHVATAFDLAKYRQQWEGYVDGVFKQKVQSEKSRGSAGKANLLNGFHLAIKDASALRDDQSMRDSLTVKLSLRE